MGGCWRIVPPVPRERPLSLRETLAGPVWHTALGALGVVIELALGCHQLQPLSDGGVGLGLLYPYDGTYPMGPASGPFGFANCSLVSPMSRIRRRLRIRTFGIPRVPHAAACFLALILGFQIQRRDGRHDFTTHGTIWVPCNGLGHWPWRGRTYARAWAIGDCPCCRAAPATHHWLR